MNNFTKDELQIILLDMDTYIHKCAPLKESPIHSKLRLKIQAMIDSYCEHEESQANHDYEVEQCKRCGALFV